MVFSTKANTPYTQMMLTHIDENGNDSPPVLIENATAANRAVNLPEFVNVPYEQFEGIDVPAVEVYRHFRRGNELALLGRDREAAVEYEKALKEASDSRIHDALARTLLRLGEMDKAIEANQQAREVSSDFGPAHNNLALLYARKGDREAARKHLQEAEKVGFPVIPELREELLSEEEK